MNDNTGFSKTLTILSLLVLAITSGLIKLKHGGLDIGVFDTKVSVCVPHTGWLAFVIIMAIVVMGSVRFSFALTRLKEQFFKHYREQPELLKLIDEAKSNVTIKVAQISKAQRTTEQYIDTFKYFKPSPEKTKIQVGTFLFKDHQDTAKSESIIVDITNDLHNKFKKEAIINIEFFRVAILECMPIFLGLVAISFLVCFILGAHSYDGCPKDMPTSVTLRPD